MFDLNALTARVEHRRWPLPKTPWVMYQRWSDLLFMHWPIAAEDLRSKVPSMLTLDTFENRAWLAVTPFVVDELRLRGLPALPGVSRFPELNVRTYVQVNGKPGVYFFSLDAASRLAVFGARVWYALPYLHARIGSRREGNGVEYQCVRTDRRAASARLEGHYAPAGDVIKAEPGSLAHWLTERYCLYAVRRNRVYRADIHHLPWPLQPATAAIEANTMALSHGIRVPDRQPLLHFSRELDVLVWPPQLVRMLGHADSSLDPDG